MSPFRTMGAAFPLNSPRMPATNSTASWLERARSASVAPADNLGGTLDWVAGHLDEDMSLKAMASRANLSVRQFSRRFQETTGTTPHQWLIRHRILRAQELLEQGVLSIEEVARCSGFRSAAAMRPHFARQLTTSPANYKRSFAPR